MMLFAGSAFGALPSAPDCMRITATCAAISSGGTALLDPANTVASTIAITGRKNKAVANKRIPTTINGVGMGLVKGID